MMSHGRCRAARRGAARDGQRPSAQKKEAKPKGEKKPRPLNAYMRFAQEMRPKVVKENPSLAVTDIAKELGRRYAALSAAEKESWKAKAQKEVRRFVLGARGACF